MRSLGALARATCTESEMRNPAASPTFEIERHSYRRVDYPIDSPECRQSASGTRGSGIGDINPGKTDVGRAES